MLKNDGEQQLKEFSRTSYQTCMHRINHRIFHFVGYGHSNCIVIEGDTSLTLIDTLDTDERAQRVRQEIESLTGKQVKTILYTHGHPDHRGGAGAFSDTATEIIAFAPAKPVLKYTDKISDILMQRMAKQFGYELTNEEVITQGIGIREGFACGEGVRRPLEPTTVYREASIERVIDGVPMIMVAALGETDDQMFVWLPDDQVLCCGDNYYACWPNLYAIRGGQYRDIAAWVDSLELIKSYPAKALLPGHTAPVLGYQNIQEVLGNYKGAIESILIQTLDCMNRGMTEDETVQQVKLPEEYQDKPYLGEFYGTVAWSVRAVYQGYLGWFDGNPSKLNPLPAKQYANKMVMLAGGVEHVLKEIKTALASEEYQWAAELCDLILQSDFNETEEVKNHKAECLLALAKQVTSANARHYYIACAKELIQ